jgi:hypothetical protein
MTRPFLQLSDKPRRACDITRILHEIRTAQSGYIDRTAIH